MNFIPHENGEEIFVLASPPKDQNKNEEHEELVPSVGMTFDSLHEACEFYKSYALRTGFPSSRVFRTGKRLIAKHFTLCEMWLYKRPTTCRQKMGPTKYLFHDMLTE